MAEKTNSHTLSAANAISHRFREKNRVSVSEAIGTRLIELYQECRSNGCVSKFVTREC